MNLKDIKDVLVSASWQQMECFFVVRFFRSYEFEKWEDVKKGWEEHFDVWLPAVGYFWIKFETPNKNDRLASTSRGFQL